MANGATNTVSEFAPGSTTPTATLTGLDYPDALAFDSSGNLYVANGATNTVSEFAPGSTTPTATLTGLNEPHALAFDSSGNLYVANEGSSTVSEFAPGSTTPTAVLFGLDYPDALAFDSSGNLYVANGATNTVSEFAPGSTTPTATLTGLSGPRALAFDSSGNLYVANCTTKTVSEFAPGSTTPTATLSGLDFPDALAFDSSGNLYVANEDDGTVSKFTPVATTAAGGVVIRSSLPSRPMSLGGTNNAVTGINLTSAELAQIRTTAIGTLTVGDNSQIGNITFTTATPATPPGASTLVVESPAGTGQIILDDDAGAGTGLNGNGGTVTLTAGTGGIAAPISMAGVPLATQGFNATGLTLTPTLSSAPTPGAQLMLVNNTATPPSTYSVAYPITGVFTNLPRGGTISASYGGTSYSFQVNYAGGDGNDLVLTNVNPAQAITTTTLLASSKNPSISGQSVTFTATVSANSPGSGTPSGTVTFYDAGTPIDTETLAVISGADQASFATSGLAVGHHSITAAYNGDSDFATSTSSALNQTIQNETPGSTTTTVFASLGRSVFGQPVTLTATVSAKVAGAGTPTGTVTFMDGATALGTETLTAGLATLTTSGLPAGTDPITAVLCGRYWLPDQHLEKSERNGQSSFANCVGHIHHESVRLWADGDLHGHSQCCGSQWGHAYRQCDLLQLGHKAGQANARQQRQGHLQYFEFECY